MVTIKGQREKRKKIQKNLQNKAKHKNNKCFSWVTAVWVLSLSGSHRQPHLPRMPSNTADLWTCCRKTSDCILVLLRLCSCLQSPQFSELVPFLLWELSMIFYIFHRHRICLVDCVDLICSLYSYISCCPSRQLPWVPGAARTPPTQAVAPPPQLALTGANPSPPRTASGANFSGQPTCRDGNKTTIETQGQCN